MVKELEGIFGDNQKIISIPEGFFSQMIPVVQHIGELKVILYALWFLQKQEGEHPYLTLADIQNDRLFMSSLADEPGDAAGILQESLHLAVQHQALLHLAIPGEAGEQSLYFLNSPGGKASLKALQQENWEVRKETHISPTLESEGHNIFRLYEENIGPLTPLIADKLKEAENIYPAAWFKDAFRIAVENNVRKWRYVEAILQSWQERGRDGTHQQNREKDHLRYIKGEFGEFGEF